MPTYEYVCESGHEFEIKQSIKDGALSECPRLGKDHEGNEVLCCSPCKRLISPTSFVLKGSGWAKDGYGSGVTGKNKRTPKRPKGTGRL